MSSVVLERMRERCARAQADCTPRPYLRPRGEGAAHAEAMWAGAVRAIRRVAELQRRGEVR